MSIQAFLIFQYFKLVMWLFPRMMTLAHRVKHSGETADKPDFALFRQSWNSLSRYALPVRGVRTEPVLANGVQAKWITPETGDTRRTILYLHGGAWIYGWSGAYEPYVARLAIASGARALGIDYRLAPENPYPAALDDCLSAYCYLIGQGIDPRQVVVMGDSAGGNLTPALMLALKERGLPLPAAGVCLCAITDLASRGPSFQENAGHDVIPVWLADVAADLYARGCDLRDPHLSPYYGDLRGLPPLLIQAGGGEMLRDDAVAFAARANECGVDATLSIYPRMWHVWQVFIPILPEANRAVAEIGRFVREKTRLIAS